MAVSVDIEKKLHGFTLKVKLESDGSPMGILGASGSGKCVMRQGNLVFQKFSDPFASTYASNPEDLNGH